MTTGKDASQVQSVPAVGNLDSALSRITRTASENTAKSAQLASEQRDWQERQNALAMQFNAQEAAKSRSWQEYMSNTAHPREGQGRQDLSGPHPEQHLRGTSAYADRLPGEPSAGRRQRDHSRSAAAVHGRVEGHGPHQ